jgi:hypothetical protein
MALISGGLSQLEFHDETIWIQLRLSDAKLLATIQSIRRISWTLHLLLSKHFRLYQKCFSQTSEMDFEKVSQIPSFHFLQLNSHVGLLVYLHSYILRVFRWTKKNLQLCDLQLLSSIHLGSSFRWSFVCTVLEKE